MRVLLDESVPRQRATELVRQVEETKAVITITRRGVPVAELRAVTVDPEALLGSVTYLDPDLTRPGRRPRGAGGCFVIALDTATRIWRASDPKRLTTRARRTIDEADACS